MTQQVRVEGLREFQSALRRAGGRTSKVMADANQRVAERLVVRPARARAAGQPGATRKLAQGKAIRAARRSKAAVVIIGGLATTEWALGAEFGSKQYPQFQPWEGNAWTDPGSLGVGYAVHPTIDAQFPKIQDEYLTEMYEAVRRAAFPN
jgi:hypothetical protein